MQKLQRQFTFIALMADFVMDIILARDIGGFMSIMENNWKVLANKCISVNFRREMVWSHRKHARKRVTVNFCTTD